MLETLGLGYLSGKLMDKIFDKSTDSVIDNMLSIKKESRRIQEIYNRINEFNESFISTDIDTHAFQVFLEKPETQELFFNHIFIHTTPTISNNDFVEHLIQEALLTINTIYLGKGWKKFSNVNLLREYFEATLNHLIKIRDSILTESERAQLVLIQQYIRDAKNEILNKLNENNTSSIRSEIDKKIELLRNVKRHASIKDYKTIIRFIDISMKEDVNSEEALKIEPVEKFVYKIFYNACLNTESKNREWISLGLDVQFYTSFEELLLFLNRTKDMLSLEDFQSYLSVLMTLLNEDEWKLFFYLKVYLEDEKILNFIDKYLIEYRPVFGPPLDMKIDRGFWRYVIDNLGTLDPYPLSEIIKRVANKDDSHC